MTFNTILIFDVYYFIDKGVNKAVAAAMMYPSFDAPHPVGWWRTMVEGVADYVPGNFCQRELPCLKAVMAQIPPDVMERVAFMITDSYTHFSATRPGLGWKLWEEMGQKIPVIGIAKNKFKGAVTDIEVHRGETAIKPLWVTSVGYPVDYAAILVEKMHGSYRLPEAVKAVDNLSRGLFKNS